METVTMERFIADPTFINYCLGTDEQDVVFWTTWRDANPIHQPLFEEARAMVFLLRDQPSTEEFEGERVRMQGYIGDSSKGLDRYFFRRRPFLAVAASLIFLLGIVLLCFKFYSDFTSKGTAVAWVDQQVPARKTMALTLADGTKVTLSASSKLSYPVIFSDTVRQVTLDGSALFDVSKQIGKPFVIATADLEIRVLGTTFKLDAFDEDDYIQLALFSGKVAVSRDGLYEEILPGTQLRYSKVDGTFALSKFDVTQTVDLRELAFTHATYQEVKQKLSRYYGVVFVAAFPVEMDFSGRYYQESLSSVLSSLSYTTAYQFKANADTVFVTKK